MAAETRVKGFNLDCFFSAPEITSNASEATVK